MASSSAAAKKAETAAPAASNMASSSAAAKKEENTAPAASNDGAKAAGAASQAERKFEQLNPTRRKLAEFVRNEHVVIAHATNTPQDILQPEYYAHVSDQLKARDRITVWADNMTWMAEIVVLEVGKGWAKVHPINLVEFDVAASIKGLTYEREGYRVAHRGEFSQWSVIRIADSEVVSENHGTQGGAVDWLENHLKAQAR